MHVILHLFTVFAPTLPSASPMAHSGKPDAFDRGDALTANGARIEPWCAGNTHASVVAGTDHVIHRLRETHNAHAAHRLGRRCRRCHRRIILDGAILERCGNR